MEIPFEAMSSDVLSSSTTQAGEEAAVSSHGERPVILMAHPGAELYGADRVFLESVDSCIADGLEVFVTTPGEGPLIEELKRRHVQVIHCSAPVVRKSLLTFTGMLRLVRDSVYGTVEGWKLIRRIRPRVVYVNTLTIPLWIPLARIGGIPVVSHVHEAEGSIPKILRVVLAAPLLMSNSIILNSRFSSDVLCADIPMLRRKSSIVLNGISGPLKKSAPRTVVNGPLKLLYVGRLSHRKGVDVAVEAVRHLQDRGIVVHLDVVGTVFLGNEAFEEQLEALISRLDVQENVTMHGFQNDVWEFLEDTDIAIVPSRADESFGNTAVEAILAARPLIASNKPGLLEAAGPYATAQFVPAGDPGALSDAIAVVYENWAFYRDVAPLDSAAAAARQSTKQFRDGIRSVLYGHLH